MKFIDHAHINIISGDGGKGHISFRREKFTPKGGPDGGNGGKGGDVLFETNPQMTTLLDFRYKRHYKAKNGQDGGKKKCTGRSADPLIIKVPCGTIIKEKDTGEIIADLTEPYQQFIVAKGGRGGRGNSEFATATNQTPRYSEDGKLGQEIDVTLELKLIADVGFVGYPSVGKSTLISVISAAKPKIADYHFTTLVPNLGIVYVDNYKSYTVADIPGLIEGASDGKGLGHKFLRHVERTRLLLFIIEAYSEDPVDDYTKLMNELCKYNPEMKFKEKLVVFNKIDCIDNEKLNELKEIKFPDDPQVKFISAATAANTEELKFTLWDYIKPQD